VAVDAPLFLVARTVPVRHGFTLRSGGVSEGKRATLDLGPAANAGEDALENRARLGRAVGLRPDRLVLAEQVHGTTVVRASPGTVPEADALWTDAPDAWIGIRTADCVPVLLCSEDGSRVAAVHSGWRGTVSRIAQAAVGELGRAGATAERLRAAIGPAIGACCYDVSEDLAARFAEAFGAEVVRRDGGQPRLDLRLAVRRTLIASGIPEAHIEDVPGCNACDAARFFSHRRDRGGTGRHLAFITPGLVS